MGVKTGWREGPGPDAPSVGRMRMGEGGTSVLWLFRTREAEQAGHTAAVLALCWPTTSDG